MTTDTKNKVLTRDQVKVEETWRLEDIFPTDEAWEQEFKEIEQLASKAETFKGTLDQGADALFEALSYRDTIYQRMGKLYTYAHLKGDQDTTNSFYQAMESRAKTLYVKISTALSYLAPELLSIPEEELNSLVENNDNLKVYKHEFEEMNAYRAHILPAEQEAILAQMGEVTGSSSETFSKLNNADLTFPSVKD